VKTSTQLKARIRILAKEQGVDAAFLLRRFLLERLLERVCTSRYRDNFVLKGGLLVSSIAGITARTTMDMDASVRRLPLSSERIGKVLDSILSIPLDDGATFVLRSMEEVRGGEEYHGFRVTVEARIDKTREIIGIDISTGDCITPEAVLHEFLLILEPRSIRVRSYPVETVLAEKIETILSRGITNTRMRDFYDIWLLSSKIPPPVPTHLLTAIENTFTHRHSTKLLAVAASIIAEIRADGRMLSHWERYRRKYSFAEMLSWETVIHSIANLSLPRN
jgi:predicted nucleotidyltransferase component of viral defense system